MHCYRDAYPRDAQPREGLRHMRRVRQDSTDGGYGAAQSRSSIAPRLLGSRESSANRGPSQRHHPSALGLGLASRGRSRRGLGGGGRGNIPFRRGGPRRLRPRRRPGTVPPPSSTALLRPGRSLRASGHGRHLGGLQREALDRRLRLRPMATTGRRQPDDRARMVRAGDLVGKG